MTKTSKKADCALSNIPERDTSARAKLFIFYKSELFKKPFFDTNIFISEGRIMQQRQKMKIYVAYTLYLLVYIGYGM